MNNYTVKLVSEPITNTLSKIESIFQISDTYDSLKPIIKDYIYIESRRIIA